MDQLNCNDAAQDSPECQTEDHDSFFQSTGISEQVPMETHEEEAAHGGKAPAEQVQRSPCFRNYNFVPRSGKLASLTIQEEPREDNVDEMQLSHSPCVLDYGPVMSASMKEVASAMQRIAEAEDDEEEEDNVGLRRSPCQVDYEHVITRSIRQVAVQKLEEDAESSDGEAVAVS
eukprot:TRINITY_DN19146_c0_g2_i1.p1 TRINITY_DN19146_c0_g2~~TRINITY_DN19146_c0_g2_i1.p1  ORF type:complete len:174 (-),score=49.80 TRINITY_DN19146_c0_g2_i1:262-783(-)